MKYQKYDAFDFLKDEFFMQWIRNPTPETEKFWVAWLQLHPEKSDEIAKARKLAKAFNYQEEAMEAAASNALLERIMLSVDRNKGGMSVAYAKDRGHSTPWYQWGIAASVLLAILFAGFTVWQNALVKDGNEAKNMADASPVFLEKENPAGVKSTLRLPDGSVITLNAKSKLKIPEQFSQEKREVWLEGEAFFDIAHDGTRPFWVHSGEIATQVLGTSFLVNTRQKGEALQIALVTGKVTIQKNGADNKLNILDTLYPGEAFLYQNGGYAKKSKFNQEKLLAWMHDTILFDQATFTEVVDYLSDWYGVSFEIQKKPKYTRAFSGNFKGMSLEEVLKNISFSSGFQYTIQGKKVVIH